MIGIYMDLFFKEKTITLMPDTNNVLIGKLFGKNRTDYSFAINNLRGINLKKDIILPSNSTFNSQHEYFMIILDKKMPAIKYILKLYASSVERQDSSNVTMEYELIIKNE